MVISYFTLCLFTQTKHHLWKITRYLQQASACHRRLVNEPKRRCVRRRRTRGLWLTATILSTVGKGAIATSSTATSMVSGVLSNRCKTILNLLQFCWRSQTDNFTVACKRYKSVSVDQFDLFYNELADAPRLRPRVKLREIL